MSRYSNFWLRQARYGFARLNAVNLATVALFNDGAGAQYIVLRNFILDAESGGTQWNISVQNGNIAGGTAVTTSAMVPGDTPKPGLLSTLDTAVAITPNFGRWPMSATPLEWNTDLAIAVLPPSWAFVMQDVNPAHIMSVTLWWEVPTADQLETLLEQIVEH